MVRAAALREPRLELCEGLLDRVEICLLYTSDAADDMQCVDLGGRRIIKKNFFQAEDGIRDER